jgi:hypothetical protein
MLIPRFWSQATARFPDGVSEVKVWRHSEKSLEEAQIFARQAADERLKAILKGDRKHRDYPSTPIREEILLEYRKPSGELWAAITRSPLGFRVLNTESIIFIDSDYRKPGFFSNLKARFSNTIGDPRVQWEEKTLEKMESVFQKLNLGGRVYRTANGLRILVTTHEIPAGDGRSRELLQICGSDELYQKLCRVQKSYRARLTPKPRRLEMKSLGLRHPLAQGEKEIFESWQRDYTGRSTNFSVCRFLKNMGVSGNPTPSIREIIQLHDHETQALENRELR